MTCHKRIGRLNHQEVVTAVTRAGWRENTVDAGDEGEAVRDASSCVASLAARGVAPPDIACEWPARQRAAVSSGAVLSKMTEERYVPSLHGPRGATSPRGGGGEPHDSAFAGEFGGDLGASLALLGYDEHGEEDAMSASQRARSRWQRTRDLARSTVAKVKAYRALGGLGSSG